MDATGEKHRDLRGAGRISDLFQERAHHRVPEHQARHRADMATAFATLEDETLCALFKEHAEQARRGHMQVGGDAVSLERAGLIGPPAGDERKAGTVAQRHRDLRFDERGGGKAQQAHAPRLALEPLCHLGQQGVGLRRAHQRKGDHRQCAGIAHGLCKGRRITDPRHRALHDGPLRAMRDGDPLPRAQHIALRGLRERGGAVIEDRAGQTPEAAEAARKIGGKGGGLPQRCDLTGADVPAEGGAGQRFLRGEVQRGDPGA